MNTPMIRPSGAPSSWMMNAIMEHGKKTYSYNVRGHVELCKESCHCSACIRKEYPDLEEGSPAGTSEEWSKEFLVEKGYVGLYRKEIRVEMD